MGEIKDKWYILDLRTNKLLYGIDGYSLYLYSEDEINILARQFFDSPDKYVVFCVKSKI